MCSDTLLYFDLLLKLFYWDVRLDQILFALPFVVTYLDIEVRTMEKAPIIHKDQRKILDTVIANSCTILHLFAIEQQFLILLSLLKFTFYQGFEIIHGKVRINVVQI